MDLSKLPPDDRADFEKRLARLGIDASSIEDEVLEVEPGQNLRLEMSGDSPVNPMIFETKDLDTLRRWIGSPDRAVKSRVTQPFEAIVRTGSFAANVLSAPKTTRKRESRSARSAAIGSGKNLSDMVKIDPGALLEKVTLAKADPANIKLKSSEIDTIRAAARNFIHGDVNMVEGFKPALEAFFGEFQIAVWLKTNIVVKKNSTLTLGTGVHNMTAHELIIESGGRVRSHGHLTVSVTKIRRPFVVNPNFRLPNHVLTIDTLPRNPF